MKALEGICRLCGFEKKTFPLLFSDGEKAQICVSCVRAENENLNQCESCLSFFAYDLTFEGKSYCLNCHLEAQKKHKSKMKRHFTKEGNKLIKAMKEKHFDDINKSLKNVKPKEPISEEEIEKKVKEIINDKN